MIFESIRLGTRTSPLAQTQAKLAADIVRDAGLAKRVELCLLTSQGDQIADQSLAGYGGKGLFTGILDRALLRGEIDLAVHSLKDLPAPETEGTVIAAVLESEDAFDALVLPRASAGIADGHNALRLLPDGAMIGTASPRRQALLAAIRPDLRFQLLRGNVGTRLAKLDRGDINATILACAGLARLKLSDRVTARLDPDIMVPSANQGVIGLVARQGDDKLCEWLGDVVDHYQTRIRITAERAVLVALGASCVSPVGVYALVKGDKVRIRAVLGSLSGETPIVVDRIVTTTDVAASGANIGAELRERSSRIWNQPMVSGSHYAEEGGGIS